MTQSNQGLIISIILLFCFSVIAISFVWYLIKFFKKKNTTRIYNLYLIVLVSMIIILGIFISIYILFQFKTVEYIKTKQTLYLIISGFINLAIVMVFIIIFLQKMGLAVSEEEIVLIGEKIKISKIKSIIYDSSCNKIFINYTQGKRDIKKIAFNKTSTTGVFINDELEKLGLNIENGDEKVIFKQLIKEIHQNRA